MPSKGFGRRVLAGLIGGLVIAGCGGPAPEVTELLAATDVKTGWFDVGVENGMNKLVPSVTLRLTNISDEPIRLVQLNAVVRRAGETEEWGGAYVQAIGSEGLSPGASTQPIVLRSSLGYTSTDPRAKMLTNKEFVDVRVELFAKLGGAQWVKLTEVPITRELLVR